MTDTKKLFSITSATANPSFGPVTFRCVVCGAHIEGRQSAVHHAKAHDANGEAHEIAGMERERVEVRYGVSSPSREAGR